jgi:hypothetical protein
MGDVWRTSDALATGATGWSQRVPASRRPLRGVRLSPDADPQDPIVRARAAGLVLPSEGVLGGWAAAALLGVPPTWLDGRTRDGRLLPVPIVVPAPGRARTRHGFRLTQARLDAGDVVARGGVPVTSGVRTAFDLIRHAPDLKQAVARGDACIRHRLTDVNSLLGYVLERPGWRGVGLARQAVPLLDRRAESPKESELRVVWTRSGLGVPVPQRTILDELGVFIARVDLLDAKAGVVGEYMGRWHRAGERPWRDTVRGRGLDGVGLEVVEFWSPDLQTEERTLDILRPGYRRAARRDPAERTYLILV